MKAMNVNQKFAEPRYHQSIGKVERIIGYIQSILRLYNIEFDGKFVSRMDTDLSWNTISSILPLIQFSINRRKSRISTISPAMLMLGSQLNDIPDITLAINKLQNGLKNNNFKQDHHQYLSRIQNNLQILKSKYKDDWSKYTRISKMQYDKRYNLLPKRDKNNKIIPHSHAFGYDPISSFQKGMNVLYYVGPHKSYNGKWRQMWTGPWQIASDKDNLHIQIADKDGKIREVSVDRLKTFKSSHYKDTESWKEYQNSLDIVKKNQPNLSDNDED